MTRDPDLLHDWTPLLGGVALGAAAMFVLDPDKGRRRRALARDKTRSLAVHARDSLAVAARDTSHRVRGLRARARRLLGRPDIPDELLLIERVRARMGRLVAHPHAIQVGASGGRVTLSGPILAHEVERLLGAVRSVWGVADVENRLVVHDRAESISSLQGGDDMHRMRSGRVRENWPPALRVAALAGGAAIALLGARQRSLQGFAVFGAGVALMLRGTINVPILRLAEPSLDRGAAQRSSAPEALPASSPPPDAAQLAAEAKPALH
jgi:hypothetical protein